MKRRMSEFSHRPAAWAGTGVTVVSAATLWLLLAAPAVADPYPWCAQYGRDGGRNCGFLTLQQCLDTVSGVGGGCERNLFYTGPERMPDRKPRKSRERETERKR
ncbi:MAG TPA: DUF3551 domain-containing protein [Pseudolabrys sp.]|nr:DUF3551 domain-containing protein [Pseudolabrys sp.]